MITIYIYGLFNKQNFCLWIGQTTDPKTRKGSHLNAKRSQFYEMRGDLTFRTIRTTDWVNASRIETQVTMAYRRKGHPLKNKKLQYGLCLRDRDVRRAYKENPEVQPLGFLDRLDWTKQDAELARETGLNYVLINRYRKKMKFPPSIRKHCRPNPIIQEAKSWAWNKTFKEIGDEHGISRQRAHQIYKKLLAMKNNC